MLFYLFPFALLALVIVLYFGIVIKEILFNKHKDQLDIRKVVFGIMYRIMMMCRSM